MAKIDEICADNCKYKYIVHQKDMKGRMYFTNDIQYAERLKSQGFVYTKNMFYDGLIK
jgi:hypothetical protein